MKQKVIFLKANSFRKYLVEQTGLSTSSVEKYVKAVSAVSNLMISEDVISCELYNMSIDEYSHALSLISARKSYIEMNTTGNNMYSSALHHYEKYLTFQKKTVNSCFYLEDKVYAALVNETQMTDHGVTLTALCNDVFSNEKSVKRILDEANWAKEEYHRYYFVDSIPTRETMVDFFSLESYAYTRPISLNYFGELSSVCEWRELYLKFLYLYQEDYPNILKEFAQNSDGGFELSSDCNKEDDNFLYRCCLKDGIVVDLNKSATAIVSQIRKLLFKARVDYENVIVFYKRNPFVEYIRNTGFKSLDMTKLINYLLSRKYTVYYNLDFEASTEKNCYHFVKNNLEDIMFFFETYTDFNGYFKNYIVLNINEKYIFKRYYFEGFDKIIVNRQTGIVSLYFSSFDDVKKSLISVCNLIDGYFKSKNQRCKIKPYSNDTGLTIKEAIAIVLSNFNYMLTVEEIYSQIIMMDLYRFGAKDPINVVRVELKRSCVNVHNWANSYDEKLFVFDGDSKYGLLTKNSKEAVKNKDFLSEEIEWIKRFLNDELVNLSELKDGYYSRFPNVDKEKIEKFNFKELGYSISDNIIYKSTESPDKFFKKYFVDKDILDLSDKEWVLKNNSAYFALNTLKKTYQIIEFSKLKFITMKKLNAKGIFESDIEEFCSEALKFSCYKCFTIFSLRKSGFYNKLFDLGFEKTFYNSLIIYNPKCSYQKINGDYLFKKGCVKANLANVIKDYIAKEGATDIYCLINWIEEVYGISLDKYRLLRALKDTTLYYSDIMEKVYKDYNQYFMEV